jgi:pyrrolysine biosynthesis protein PylC
MISQAGPVQLEEDFFGADEALTNRTSGQDEWVATLMVKGEDLPTARKRRDRVIAEIRDRLGVAYYSDEYPDRRFGQKK